MPTEATFDLKNVLVDIDIKCCRSIVNVVKQC